VKEIKEESKSPIKFPK